MPSADRTSEGAVERSRRRVGEVYRSDSCRVFATLVRLLGDLDLAEDAMHNAFAAALERWPKNGVPANPRAWLVSTGRFKAIDSLRRRARFDAALAELADRLDAEAGDPAVGDLDGQEVKDDRLRLIFTCCHPVLSQDAQTALTLREVCGLATEDIARAFLVPPPTLAQRIVRAKAKIRDERVPYRVPPKEELPDRLEGVLRVVYLVFNEGYYASTGDSLTRPDLSGEAIRLGRVLVALLPEPEAVGLLALMLLTDSRRAARTAPTGDLIPLEEQDRSLWDGRRIAEGTALVRRALSAGRFGPYTIQAAIAAVHAQAPSVAATDWPQIVGLYDVLARVVSSPVVELNRAVAVAMRDGPEAGLVLVEGILDRGELTGYHLAHAARADLCRRLGRTAEARASYERALGLAEQGPERRFLAGRLAELSARSGRSEAIRDFQTFYDALSILRFAERLPCVGRKRKVHDHGRGDDAMRFLVTHKSNEENEAGISPSRDLLEKVGRLMEESAREGVLLAAEGVHPSSRGALLSFSGGRRTVTDGPFAEAKELIAGFVVIQVDSKDDAIEWATRLAEALGDDDVEIEVRQVVELSDLPPENMPPEAAPRVGQAGTSPAETGPAEEESE